MMMKTLEYQYDGDWNVTDGKLYKGKRLMNENYEFVDSIKQMTKNEATIFLNDTRVATTVVDKGNRAIGTKAAAEVVEQVIKKGVP
jgi:methyl-accepting chemotaxis protein